jgi:transposase
MTKYGINLSPDEQEGLTTLLKKGKRKVRHIQYAQILMGSDEANGNTVLSALTLSERFLVSAKTVERVGQRFCEQGMGVFETKPRLTRNDKRFDARVESHLLAIACQSPPDGAPRWKLQMLSDRLVELEVVDRISGSSVCNLLKKNEIRPFQKERYVIPGEQSAAFVCQMEQVSAVYERP